MKTLRTMIFASAMAAATLASSFAAAHAGLKSSDPVAGSILATAPKEIKLTFNEKVEATFSSIKLTSGEGKAVAASKATVDEANPAIMRVEVPALPTGAYSVTWVAVGGDGHRRKGDFKFAVK
ncbi:MAG: methionine-rich copper-binding protein CopC [Janthinobacterium sp.]|jgi:methionine-rich copper-binding protein CopC